ncbi:MAG: aspartate--ammonia ligase [Clostridia bacterium]|nr:aspartate--ammonia ligase [Clostridia bacterium]
MRKLYIPQGYSSKMTLRETQKAIKIIKDTFQVEFAKALNLDRVTAPVIVRSDSGINDDLNGVERKVQFDLKEMDCQVEVVQSLAKWKRFALHRYSYNPGEGIYTDMTAIRRDDDVDNIHSIYVDQWDWEKVITSNERTMDFLKDTVRKIVSVMAYTQEKIKERYPEIKNTINKDVYFITSQELEDMYPNLSGKERESAITKKYKTVFIMQIGKVLKSGNKHDGRAPDYDDWELNGDIMVWNEVMESALELSSMGIRVDAASLKSQLEAANATDRMKFNYHKGIADGTLPLTIGGGIGQSRLCMFMLEKAHIGEVQVSVWPEDMIKECKENKIILL